MISGLRIAPSEHTTPIRCPSWSGGKIELGAARVAPWLDPVPWHEYRHRVCPIRVGVKPNRNLTDFVQTIAQSRSRPQHAFEQSADRFNAPDLVPAVHKVSQRYFADTFQYSNYEETCR